MADCSQEVYLHGDLDLKIFEAIQLPNMDIVSEHLRRCFTACGTIDYSAIKSVGTNPRSVAGDGKLHHGGGHGKIITSDPYVTVRVPQATVARTRVIKNSQNPNWNEHFIIPLAQKMAELEFQVKDDDVFGAEVMGTVKFPAQQIASGDTISGWFPVIGSNGKPPKPGSSLRIEMKFTSVEKNPVYRHGIAGDPEHKGVQQTYFPVRKGSSMRLYQDAHVADGLLPQIELDGGNVYRQEKCWEDICHAISEAHHMIYIVGWSVFHKVKLVREPSRPLPRGGELNLGELLKYKSEEGVRVLMLVWDDKTSHDKFFINTGGLMQTHDEETQKFFKHSSVICVLSPRYASGKLSYMKQKVVGNVFTHHQKFVLVDTQGNGNYRKITAFLGGLDLCDGRYDTPEHRLFRDLDTVFKEDFHNPTIPPGTNAPRQPWHDLHCRIDGPAAYDLLINFEQRWKRAIRWTEFGLRCKRITHWRNALIKIERISWILSPQLTILNDGSMKVPEDDPKVYVSKEEDRGNWHVQVFRSIDSGSVKGFPKDVHLAELQNLVCAKNLTIEKSIEMAYIQAIRSAQHFIYIENQYFIGSSYGWPGYKNAGADNLIPMELALKIASKIRAKERFVVYIIIPMWPEGDPNSGPVQEILYWQGQTMQMMYDIVASELKSSEQPDLHPLDYLNFYCLGKREEIPENGPTTDNATVSNSIKHKRFMIYVHAKGMIVDDEYVIIGSANINQRSMAGSKDTEIATGAYQPHHTWAKNEKHPHGQIYGYRMSLWSEHLGMLDSYFEEPETLECVRKVNGIAEDNWKRFAADEFSTLQGHLLRYPLLVDVDGKVNPRPGYENFPDVGGKIIGSHSVKIPDVVTT